MARWIVELVGERADLELIREELNVPSCRIAMVGDRVRLLSDRFDTCGGAAEVMIEAERLCANMNAVAKLFLGVDDPIKVGDRVIEQLEDGKERRHVLASCRMDIQFRARAKATVLGPDGQEIPPQEPISGRAMKLAMADAEVSRVLDYFREGTWGALYKVVEAIEHDAGGRPELEKKGWVDRDEIRRFKESAENPEAAGRESRHHRYKGQRKPEKPMSKRDATRIVGTLLRKWIEAKPPSESAPSP